MKEHIMFYVNKLVNLVLNQSNKLLFLLTGVFMIIMSGGDIPPENWT